MEPITQKNENSFPDEKLEKISLIEDIFKVKRCLFGFDKIFHRDVITNPEYVFDCLYEESLPDLELKLAVLSAELSQTARQAAGF